MFLNPQELQDVRSRHESRIVEVESGRRREFEGKLTETMQHLRQEHDVQVQQYKEELERNFSTKVRMHVRMHTASIRSASAEG